MDRQHEERGDGRPERRPTVLITGAGGAVGGVMADHFAGRGWALALVARPAGVDALRARWPDATVAGADLTVPDEVRAALATIEAERGGVDALLNVAGAFAMHGATEAGAEELEAQLDANLRTAFVVTGAVLPGMLARGRGAVVGVSAAAGLRGGRRMTTYAASKAALTAYLRSVRAEVASRGVGVSVLVPMGAIDTPANRAAMPGADPDGWLDPAALAEAAEFLVTRGPRGRVHELRVHADGG